MLTQDCATKILIVYSTIDGHSTKICQSIAARLENEGNVVTVYQLKAQPKTPCPEISQFDKIIVGGSIRYGKHSDELKTFINKNSLLLTEKVSGFFSVNLVARKATKNNAETNPYVRKFLTQISWQPQLIAIFAGKIDYPKYSYWDRQMIRLIMWMTKGPTDPNAVIDFTNWQQVEQFAIDFHQR